MNERRVRSIEHRFRNKMNEIEETRIQYLEELHTQTKRFLWWTWTEDNWIEIDREIVPSFAWMQVGALGSTDWKSKWNGMANTKWIKYR